ncbi:hypothetical protein ACIBEA_10270 [Streptomyces sp. NPDC051555]|uniref:hypothetical protein n=1 Tax=Streptomyces sp. NPDC051555 TaxID=3365657 RepID=UPI0037AC6895
MNDSRFIQAREALEQFAPLIRLKSIPAIHPTYGSWQLPELAWRFAEARDDLRETFTSIARTAPKNTEWTLVERKNSFILPLRLANSATGPNGEGISEARLSIVQSDQEFCAAANEDMDLIIQAIAEAGSKREPRPGPSAT